MHPLSSPPPPVPTRARPDSSTYDDKASHRHVPSSGKADFVFIRYYIPGHSEWALDPDRVRRRSSLFSTNPRNLAFPHKVSRASPADRLSIYLSIYLHTQTAPPPTSRYPSYMPSLWPTTSSVSWPGRRDTHRPRLLPSLPRLSARLSADEIPPPW
ncbi:hypothetical protein FA13DRAFT_937610 [Coprinellus micaceus]|uniref:Uncharacterized protein n=1 Tax=Coprinellus micaceus TaxID=71717 RepID=A0A4Y7T1E8_COPMI|nr:hypothetical protein FA13DRAFT_937610 [Coprinellus micaceus]